METCEVELTDPIAGEPQATMDSKKAASVDAKVNDPVTGGLHTVETNDPIEDDGTTVKRADADVNDTVDDRVEGTPEIQRKRMERKCQLWKVG